jgi:hypothetical protein
LKTLIILIAVLCIAIQIQSQEPLSRTEALRQLYQQYDGTKKTAQWVCPKDTPSDVACWDGEDATVSITLLLAAEVMEDGAEKMFFVASAKPSKANSYECHYCGPAIGVAVFAWQSNKWVLQSKNQAVGFYGSFGEPGQVDLVAIGPHRYGLVLYEDFGGQGYYESTKTLLIPLADSVRKVWSAKDREDDRGDDFDNNGKPSDRIRHFSLSGMDFFWTGGPEGDLGNKYYSLSVISHRTSFRFRTHWVKESYWEDTYKFDGSKYVRASHEQLTKVTHHSERLPN